MYQRKNFAYGTVLTPPDPAASGTTVILNSGHGARFPNTSGGTYVCVVKEASLPATPSNSEVVLVTTHDPAGDTFTVTREQESSSARTILVGDEFYLAPTDGVWDQIDVLTTKGDLMGFDTAYARVPVGTNDQVLTADSTDDQGVAWKSVGAVSNIRGEVPTGTVNGTNTDFTIANTPTTGTLRVYVNGIRQKVTDDYTLSGTTITFVSAPLTDSKLLVDYEVNAGTYATGSADFVNNETPSGTVNGTNAEFTLANTPVSGTLHLFRDGQEVYLTNDYTLSTATITFVAAPVTGSVLRASYQKTVSTAGNADLLDGLQGAEYATLTGTETLTNKTLTSPKINEDVALTSTSTELNALDGKTGEWLTSWNPTLNGITAGSGTKVSKYVQIGKIVHFFLSFALAADSSVSGRISFALPVNSKVGTFQVNGYALDSGTGNMPLFAFAFSNAIYVDAFNTSTTYASSTSSSSTVPFTWTTSDVFYISGTYEAA